jgi:predicted transposase/invertase (TIGR01784 family)
MGIEMIDKEDKITNSNTKHDEGYRKLFSSKENFLHFLKKYIGETWVNSISVEDIEQVNASFVTDDFQKRDSDVIYRLNSKNVYFYVLTEMQSAPDFSIPFRLLRYMTNLLADEFKNTAQNIRVSKSFRLPAIVPIVFYNGEEEWNPVMSFKEYTANYGDFGDNIIDFKYILFDLKRYNKEDILTTHKVIDFVFNTETWSHLQSQEDFGNAQQALVEYQRELSDEELISYLTWYANVPLKGRVDSNFVRDAFTAIRKGEVEIMTHAIDRLLEERGKEAEKQGENNRAVLTARKMLKKGKPIDEIIEFTDLTREEVEKLK